MSIEDVNDNSPEWTGFEDEVFLMENATVGTEVTVVSAIDADTGLFGTVRYYITGGAVDLFSINSTSVSMKLNNH